MEWSRSRYWLCHFLNSRHQRPTVAWPQAGACANPDPDDAHAAPIWSWAGQRWPGDDLGGDAFIASAAQHHADDPAYVQSLRLLAKERGHWAGLLDRLRAARAMPAPIVSPRRRAASALALRLTRRLGPRFELSILMLTALAHQRLIVALSARAHGTSPADAVLAIIQREQADHLAFYVERLTLELADLNFVRRSLRRLRLRLMFAGFLADTIHRHGPALRSAGVRRLRLVADAWRSFELCLSRAVPYLRHQLIAALLDQRQRPYAPALRG